MIASVLYFCLLLLSSNLVVASKHMRVAPRQDATTTTTNGLQPFSSTVVYSFSTLITPTATTATSCDTSTVTTSTVITVYAQDQFHAYQSFLTAGQSVIDSAKSSAAAASCSLMTPATISATSTDTCSSTAMTTTTNTMVASSTSTSISAFTPSPTNSGASRVHSLDRPTVEWLQQCLTFLLSTFWV